MLKIKSSWQKRLAEFYIQIPFSWGLGWLRATNTVWNFGRTQWEDLPLYKIHTLQGHCTTSCLLSTRRYCCLRGQPTIANVLAPGEITWFSTGEWKILGDVVQALQSLKPSLQQRAVHERCSSPRQPSGGPGTHPLNISLPAEGACYRKLTKYLCKHITLKMAWPITLLQRNLKVSTTLVATMMLPSWL